MSDIFKEVKISFKDSIEKLFSDEIVYAFLTGSFAYRDFINTSDIDVVVVLNPNGTNSEELIYKRHEFTKEYLKIHENYSFNPDLHFPGEVISKDMINDAVDGRGYKVNDGFYLEDIVYEEQWDDPELEYRCWRSMLAFNNNQFLIGDKKCFEKDRLASNIEITKYLLLENLKSKGSKKYNIPELKDLLINRIISGNKEFLGLKNGSTYQNDLNDIYDQIFPILISEDYLLLNGNKVIPNKDKLLDWKNDKLYKLENGLFNTPHLFDWNEIRSKLKYITVNKYYGYLVTDIKI
jgi:predicted nucleotidyltransferase